MKRRSLLIAAPVSALATLAGCAGPRIEELAQELPRLDLRQYFNGMVDAWASSPIATAKWSSASPW